MPCLPWHGLETFWRRDCPENCMCFPQHHILPRQGMLELAVNRERKIERERERKRERERVREGGRERERG